MTLEYHETRRKDLNSGNSLLFDWNTTLNYFEPIYFVQRFTASKSGHSSIEFKVQGRKLACVAGLSRLAPQHQYAPSINIALWYGKRTNLKAKWKTRLLDCVTSISHFTPYKDVKH